MADDPAVVADDAKRQRHNKGAIYL
jgi:hypothetical protein